MIIKSCKIKKIYRAQSLQAEELFINFSGKMIGIHFLYTLYKLKLSDDSMAVKTY